jgi:hypothetical protein
MDWLGGQLEAQNTATCRVRMRLGPDRKGMDATRSALINQLKGGAGYSSGHPAMQALDPAVYEMFLQNTTAPANRQVELMRP